MERADVTPGGTRGEKKISPQVEDSEAQRGSGSFLRWQWGAQIHSAGVKINFAATYNRPTTNNCSRLYKVDLVSWESDPLACGSKKSNPRPH